MKSKKKKRKKKDWLDPDECDLSAEEIEDYLEYQEFIDDDPWFLINLKTGKKYDCYIDQVAKRRVSGFYLKKSPLYKFLIHTKQKNLKNIPFRLVDDLDDPDEDHFVQLTGDVIVRKFREDGLLSPDDYVFYTFKKIDNLKVIELAGKSK